ncbi:hypothetical protein A0J61_10835 [Choanephora cucurbitarum]|uniref:Uncharacterized protein n=1 Tax=Choanephora cucurbitarum TaxID=101091 RepID=A0A1C7MWC9_9FUNG|nr:hypothetical protein A0J61_10835 [Choanephora cucurbitarum]
MSSGVDMHDKDHYGFTYLVSETKPCATVELFWLKVKYGVKRKPLEAGGTLTPRIINACSELTRKDCQG